MPATARAARSPETIRDALGRLELPAGPPAGDVFFFVVDSLRADAVDPTLSPTLTRLSGESLAIDLALSGGNATHLGWYSLFWADDALGWRLNAPPVTAEGPLPLQLARKRGWRIEVLSTPNLEYMNLERTILGEGYRLADSILDVHGEPGDDGDHDARIVDELLRRMATVHAPTAYLVFLDSTHLPYSWGGDFVPPVRPFASPRHYMRVQRDPDERAAVVARYHDAVAFVDSLLGRFSAALRASGRFEDSTVVVTGDHGEEFWEHGLAGHGTELCRAQTRITTLIKLPGAPRAMGVPAPRLRVARAMDVWPTVLDAAGVRGDTSALFDGVSLIRATAGTAVIAGMRYWYPSSRFVLDDGKNRALFELSRPDEPSTAQRLDVLSLLDGDTPVLPDLTAAQYGVVVGEWFGPDLARLFAFGP